jgi:TRAP-type C4-dicarboxylate transport system permease small subunit
MDIQDNSGAPTHSLFSLRRADELIGVCALLAILASMSWGVISRYIFPQPAVWTYEVALITFAYLIFFGAVTGVRLRMHAAIDVLTATFPPRAQRAVVWFNYILLAIFFAVMATMFFWQAWTAHDIRTIALNLPKSVLYAPIAVASIGLLVAHLIVERPWAASDDVHTDSLI